MVSSLSADVHQIISSSVDCRLISGSDSAKSATSEQALSFDRAAERDIEVANGGNGDDLGLN